jgi:hypothetical protein
MPRSRIAVAALVLTIALGLVPAATPASEAATPIPTVSGPISATANSHPFNAVAWGSEVSLTAAQIDAAYPTHADYVHAVKAAAADAVSEGWITAAEAMAITVEAKTSRVGTGTDGRRAARARRHRPSRALRGRR